MNDKKEVQEDAFAGMVALSPRLRWLEQHGLTTIDQPLPRREIGPRNSMPWCCHNKAKTVCMFGEDEVDATMLYAQVMGLKHWMLEQTMGTDLGNSAPCIFSEEWEE